MPYAGKPIIGIAGGIGSGKSFVAACFGELGCRVIDSDAQVRAAYRDARICDQIREWWGAAAFDEDGQVDRGFLAKRVFSDEPERIRLEKLVHPWVNAARAEAMAQGAKENSVVAFVWDTPLLFETGLVKECDCVVFVDAPDELRAARVKQARGWDDGELKRRENLQWPLYKKRMISDYVVSNTADAAQARDQVREIFPRILAHVAKR